jgi:hypothetical protein
MTTLSIRILAALALCAAASTPLLAQTAPQYTIRSDNESNLFLEAIQVPNARITIAGNVTLNLLGRTNLHIAPGVHIVGDRSVYPRGPLIQLTAPNPEPVHYVFVIGSEWTGPSDGVRISGIRFDGFGTASANSNKVAIAVRSSIDVKIFDNEFYGWGRSAIDVSDDVGQPRLDRLSLANASAVHIHGNYFHDNYLPLGYGVVTRDGAYALIEENVFHNNRHAISGDGSDGSGYLVYRNLILPTEGPMRSQQQVDMAGRLDCTRPGSQDCGPAGEYMDVRYNTVLQTPGASFITRGKPYLRADVASNVFANSRDDAIRQNQSGNLREWNNTFNASPDVERYCDFDGDGVVDQFLATGATWWYRSTLTGYRWTYLNQSTKKIGQLTLRDTNGDGRCDVAAAGTTYYSGKTPSRSANVLWRKTDRTKPLMWLLHPDGNVYGTRNPTGLEATEEIKAVGDFDGDGDEDFFVRDIAEKKTYRVLVDDGVAVRDTQNVVESELTLYHTGDFDGDGMDDLLLQYRETSGTSVTSTRLEIWFSGSSERQAVPTWANQGGALDFLWVVKGTGDVNGDGRDDIIFNHSHQFLSVWLMNGSRWIGDVRPPNPDRYQNWNVVGISDFDGDRRADILMRSLTGQLSLWNAGRDLTMRVYYRNESHRIVEPEWSVKSVKDLDADGRADILWHHYGIGLIGIWNMDGATFVGEKYPGHDAGGTWKIEGVAALEKPAPVVEPGSSTPRVPNLWGRTLQEAVQALSAVGLAVGNIQEVDNCDLENRVAEQSPGQVMVAPGTRVDVWLGKRPPPPRQCF